ncbi:MAG: DUF4350 domain-containing protein [Candidatus Thorarchaeota archaeon]
MTRVKPILLITIFLTTMFIVPSALIINSHNGDANMMSFDGAPESQALISQLSHNARVAIYDEDNLTAHVISDAVNLTNNIAEITTLLEGAGHTVEDLTEEDILNHELITADYDVFIIVNNVPRQSITNHIKEFWMGGGGLLSFSGALSYLLYAGILDSSIITDPGGSHWIYLPSSEQNVTSRHSTMKEHHINETVSERTETWATTSAAVLDNLPTSDYTTVLLSFPGVPFFVTGFSVDINYRGGRIVQLPGDGSSIPTDFESIIIDSVEWLSPKPKGRIAYDLCHSPRLSVDFWDGDYSTLTSPTNNMEQLRNLAANHSYTFDKFYPDAAGNFTAARLAKYDVLILLWPDIDYSSAERTAVMEWVEGGGSLLVLGDRTGLVGGGTGDVFINQLISPLDMSLGTTDVVNFASMTPATHLTLEGLTSLAIGYRNYLVVLGNATEIWMDGTDAVVAGQEYGAGRVILASDMNIFDNTLLGEESNKYFALNVFNWLTATDAEILVYSDYLGSNDAPCKALRDMGISYQHFYTRTYLQDFLDSQEWELVIYNGINYPQELLRLDELYAFVDDGGRLLMTYWDFDSVSTHPLWSKLGVEFAATLTGSPTMYVWDATHDIFTTPHDHSTTNFTSGTIFSDDGDEVTAKAGYIALAGTTADVQDDKAAIVVSPDKQTLINAFVIDNFNTDEDDSTYADNVELWENEITFMLTPVGGGGFPLDTTTLLIIGGAAFALILILALVARRRGGSSKPKRRKRKKK